MTFPIKKRINIDEKHETNQELLVGPLRERYKQLARTPEHVGMKTNNGSLFEMRNYNVVNEKFNGRLFEMTNCCKRVKISKV